MPAPTYIISRVADPIFAVVIGLSAAATRINREEKAKGKTTNETIETGLRYETDTCEILNASCALIYFVIDALGSQRNRFYRHFKASVHETPPFHAL
ncbi:hypothetical protein V8C40DRAFT_193321 [Trichoderma camerunense]